MISTRRLPSQTVIRVSKVIDGQVRPGTLSTARNRRGKRLTSLSKSSWPRSSISSWVASLAMISLGVEARGAHHPDRVVVGQQDVA